MEIVSSIIISIVQSILFYRKEIGISMLLFSLIGNGIIFYILYKRNKIQNKNGILLMIPIILLSSTYFIFASKTFYIANIFILIALNIIMYVIIINKKNHLNNYIYNMFELLRETITGYKDGIEYTKKVSKEYVRTNNKIDKENIKKIAVSLLIVFVVVGIVIGLLVSADSIFANLFSGVGKLFETLNFENILSLLLRIVIIIIVYFFILSLMFNLQKEHKIEEKKLKNNKEKYIFTIKLLLITLNIVYLVFCFIQIQSLFAKINIDGAFDYASYARTGFFQLMFVSFINFAVILISNKCNDNKENIIKILNLLLVVFTVIIAVSSMYRMYMYEMEYGLTYLRIFVYIILITEILAFIPVIIYIFNENYDFMKWCFIIGICTYCITNFINIESIIVSKNINRNSTQPIDYEYIYNNASADSYEILEEKLQKEDITDTEKLDILNVLLKISSNTKDLSWQEFNISKYKMKERDIDTQELNKEIEEIKEKLEKQEKIDEILTNELPNYVYNETINENETYFVEQVDAVMGSAIWQIGKITDNNQQYNIINTIEVSTPSKIKFFENGLGFIEKPTSIYCEKSELLITHDSGKTFEPIKFQDGVFTLSDPKRKGMGRML